MVLGALVAALDHDGLDMMEEAVQQSRGQVFTDLSDGQERLQKRIPSVRIGLLTGKDKENKEMAAEAELAAEILGFSPMSLLVRSCS